MKNEENIVKKVCKELEKPTITLKTSIQNIHPDEIENLDLIIKELINIRAVFDFMHNKQLTDTNWLQIKKALK